MLWLGEFMTLCRAFWPLAAGAAFLTAFSLYAFQKPWRVYSSMEAYDNIPIPVDANEKSEWVFGRLMYPPNPHGMFSRPFRFGGRRDWREGGTSWTQDYPRADRHFAQALRRLSRINVRSVEQPVNPDDGDDIYNWPWLSAGEMGDWTLTDKQAETIREFLLRGGFLQLDDFWGPEEWARFEEGMKKIFPERPLVDIEDDDAIFHTVYDLKDRYQVLGSWGLNGRQSYRVAGTVAHWMGIYDDNKRVMVAISFNSDVGDSWEWADDPTYPEKFSALGIRIGVNYAVYDLTH
jgi:hypothetical protein